MSRAAIFRNIRRHPLMATLFELKGNPKSCVLTEPLWGVPFNLYAPLISVYMYSLGLNDRRIGLISSVAIFFQVFTALLGGIITDKLGRKATTFFFDLLAWSVPCLLWCFAQNFWWFFVAAIINSTWQITSTSWSCLMVEDAPRDKMNHIYTWIYIAGKLSVFFAPLSGLMVRHGDTTTVVRVLYFIAFLSMTAKFVILYFFSTETEQGLIRMKEVKDSSILKMLSEYKTLFKQVITMQHTRRILMLLILSNVMMLSFDNYFGLYVTQNLGFPEYYLTYFPIIRASIMLLFLFFIQHRLDYLPYKKPMLLGLSVFVLGYVILILAPPNNLSVLILSVICESTAYALFMPRRDTLMALNINPEARAGILSVMYVVMLAVSSPFGYLLGFMSNIDRRLPYTFNLVLFVLMAVIVIAFKEMKSNEVETA